MTSYSQTCTLGSLSNVAPGAVQVDLGMTGFGQSVTALQWTIEFDPAVLTFDPGTGCTNWYAGVSGVGIQSPTPGKITFVWGDTPVAINGVLCKLNFTYISATGACSNLSWIDAPTPRLVADTNYNEYTVTYTNGQICGVSTGIEDNSVKNPAVEIYPTIAKGNVNVKYSVPENGKITLGVYNLMGDEVQSFSNTFSANSENIQEINVSELNSGIYFIKYQIETANVNMVKTEKITVAR